MQIAPVPTPADLTKYYAVSYREGGRYGLQHASTKQFPHDNMFYFNRGESACALLESYVDDRTPRGVLRILDIGAGFGHTLHSLAIRYPSSERFAVEISKPCIEHLRSQNITVFTTPAGELLPSLQERFDLIVLSHVLEHFPDPFAMLELLRRALLPRGLLYIEVPNIPLDALTKYPAHEWFPRVDEPHITFFSRETLRGALESQRWTVLFCDTAGPEYRFVSWLHYHAARFRSAILAFLPGALKTFLRRHVFTRSVQIRDREPSFYRYGQRSLWLRSVSTPSR